MNGRVVRHEVEKTMNEKSTDQILTETLAQCSQVQMENARLLEVIRAARDHLIAASNQKAGSPYARMEIDTAFRTLNNTLLNRGL